MISRPVGAYTLNPNSWQSHGLVFWLPMMENTLRGRVSKKEPTLTGSPFLDYDQPRASWKFSGTAQYMSYSFAPVTGVPLTIMAWVLVLSQRMLRIQRLELNALQRSTPIAPERQELQPNRALTSYGPLERLPLTQLQQQLQSMGCSVKLRQVVEPFGTVQYSQS